MNVPVLLVWVDKLNPRSRGHQEVVGRLGDVAAMMEPIGVDVGGEFLLDFAGSRISSGVDAGILARSERGDPHQAIDHHQVLW